MDGKPAVGPKQELVQETVESGHALPFSSSAARSAGKHLRYGAVPQISRFDLVKEVVAAVVKAFVLPSFHATEAVGGEQRHGDGRVHISDDAVGQRVGSDLAPAHGFSRGGAAETSGVGPRVGALEEVVVALFRNTHDFLNLRFGLEHEVLRAAAAKNPDAAFVTGGLRLIDDRGGLVHVPVHVEHQLRVTQCHRGDVHPNGAVTGAAGENGNPALVGGGEHGAVGQTKLV